nr:nucleic acid-binding, OB-fold protein [Tanacetum cinerariifolium]
MAAAEDLQKKVIICPKNETTDTINAYVLSLLNHEVVFTLAQTKLLHTGNAIQVNMDLKDTKYFNKLLQLNNAYRVSRFGCTDTKKWQRTLDNKTTVNFGSGLNMPFVIWNDMAEKFDMDAYGIMLKLVVIAISSTWVTTRYEGLQLTATPTTPTTHYYLNPNILEVRQILGIYAKFINPSATLDIQRQPCRTDEEEKIRNRFSIQSLVNADPQH